MKITKTRLKRIIKEEIARFEEDIMPQKIKPGWLKFLSDQAQKEWFNSPSIQTDIATRRDECERRNTCLDPETFECVKCDDVEASPSRDSKSGTTAAHMQSPSI